ncbi:Ribosomal protein Rsm22, bacterial-type domain-containing protein [Rozella allomycis CSF55]|uniref:Ribosomal protein Rsm22, bacterial-type domain-containing protein n=1 Tax=Rozella allomycis (strain CSF55) TaxID=988480 RepID=A0A075ANK7_ROZAC|nr:Ribosomal protein Rsm22, bacterial-type domain-containing protein [Rozella allomycis CSF55]|eukprot:EPZ31457.1 Ribosomal protein Rsm22, bacterial-type domain-containing protein [Rozella allomycis CSF55]
MRQFEEEVKQSTTEITNELILEDINEEDDDSNPRRKLSPEYEMAKVRPRQAVLPPILEDNIKKLLYKYPQAHLKNDVHKFREAIRSPMAQETVYTKRVKDEYRKKLWNGINFERDEHALDKLEQMKREEAIDKAGQRSVPIVIEYGAKESMIYCAWQLPFTFGPILRVLNEIKSRNPDYVPKSILDVGTGPGTCLAANEVWGDVKEMIGMDTSSDMIAMAENLNTERKVSNAHVVFKRCKNFNRETIKEPRHDVVISSFVLLEIPEEKTRLEFYDRLWNQTSDFLVLIERGSPQGFKYIAEARKYLLERENGPMQGLYTSMDENGEESIYKIVPQLKGERAHVFAPQNISNYKENKVPQKFSYVVLRKKPRPDNEHNADLTFPENLANKSAHWPRITRETMKRGGHVIVDVCDNDATMKRLLCTKTQGTSVFKESRKSRWGDLWPHESKSKPREITDWDRGNNNLTKYINLFLGKPQE